jgi:hypothetical protein
MRHGKSPNGGLEISPGADTTSLPAALAGWLEISRNVRDSLHSLLTETQTK